jgi:site-specific recombinase XerD
MLTIIDSLLEETKNVLHVQGKSNRTEKSYTDWIYRFLIFNKNKLISDLSKKEIAAFLNFLLKQRNISASTHNQALQAILYLYKNVLSIPLVNCSSLRLQKEKKQLNILSKREIHCVLQQLQGEQWLMVSLLYSCGLKVGGMCIVKNKKY